MAVLSKLSIYGALLYRNIHVHVTRHTGTSGIHERKTAKVFAIKQAKRQGSKLVALEVFYR